MWEWGHLLWGFLLITFDDNVSSGAVHFPVWFLVLFLFFWRNVSSLSLLLFFVVLARMFWEHCVCLRHFLRVVVAENV